MPLRPVPPAIAALREQLAPVFKRHRVLKAIVFGCVARGEAGSPPATLSGLPDLTPGQAPYREASEESDESEDAAQAEEFAAGFVAAVRLWLDDLGRGDRHIDSRLGSQVKVNGSRYARERT